MVREVTQESAQEPGPPPRRAGPLGFFLSLVPKTPLELLELGLFVLGVGAGLLTVANAFSPILGASPWTTALLGAAAGVLTAASAVVAVFRPDTLVVPSTQQRSGVHELPASPRRFVGRRIWIARALRQLRFRPHEAPVLVITGMPGIGKSALAVVVGHRLAATEYPANQLFIDLGGGRQPVKSPEDALHEVLVKLGTPLAEIPAELDLRQAAYRNKLQDSRSLVVLDDASRPDQVLRLQPPDGCAAIVTSRVELHQPLAAGARPLRLRALTTVQALRFLTNRIGRWRVARQPFAALRLVRLLGRHPLALGCVAARLVAASGSQLPLADVVRRLEDPELRLAFASVGGDYSVMAALAFSVEGLTVEQQRVLLVIGILDATELDPEIVAAAFGTTQAVARALLGQLVDAGLLEPEERPGGPWPVHELVRAYAHYLVNRLLRDPVERSRTEVWRRQVIDRVVVVYLRRVRTLRDLESSPAKRLRPDLAAAKRAELEREWELAVALVDRAAAVGLDLTAHAVGELVSVLLEIVTIWPEIARAEDGVERIRRAAEQQQRREIERRAEEWLEQRRQPAPGSGPEDGQPPRPAPGSRPEDGQPPRPAPGSRPENGQPTRSGDAPPDPRHQDPSGNRPRAGQAQAFTPRQGRPAEPPPRGPGRGGEPPPGPPRHGPGPAGPGAPPGAGPAGGPPPPRPDAAGPRVPPDPGPAGTGPPGDGGRPQPEEETPAAARGPSRPRGHATTAAPGRTLDGPIEALYRSALRYERHFERLESWRLWAAAGQVRRWVAARSRDPARIARVHNEHGDRYERRGLFDLAERHYRASLRVRRQLGDERGATWMLDRLASVDRRRRGRQPRAVEPPQPAATPRRPAVEPPQLAVEPRQAAVEPETLAATSPDPATSSEAAPVWDVTGIGFDEETLTVAAERMAARLGPARESSTREPVSGLDRGLAGLERGFGGRTTPVRPVRFGR